MPMTIVVTRDVESRYRGLLTSIMLEIAPGMYVAPDLSATVRGRLWTILTSWWTSLGRGAIVMVWRDRTASGNLRIEALGEPSKEIVDADGILILKRH